MRKYEFKTINPQPAKPQTVPITNPSFPLNLPTNGPNYRPEQQFTQSQNRSTIQGPALSPTNFKSAAGGVGTQFDLASMKRQLEMLVKQTDYIEKKKDNASSFDNSMDWAAARSLSNNSKPLGRELGDRNQRMKNYQKYEKYLQQPSLPTFNTHSTTQNTSGSYLQFKDSTSYGANGLTANETAFQSRSNRQSYDIEGYRPTQVPKRETASFGYGQGKIENPQKSNGFTNYDPINVSRPKTEVPLPKFSSEEDRSYLQSQNYYSPSKKPSYPEAEDSQFTLGKKSDQADIKSPINQHDQIFVAKPVPKPAQNQAIVAELQSKIKTLEVQSEKLKEELKDMKDNKEYYRSQLADERKNGKKMEEQLENKMKKIQEGFQQQKQSYLSQIQQIKSSHEAEITKLVQQHQAQILQLTESHENALSTLKQSLEGEILSLNQQLQAKKANIVGLIKELKDQPQVEVSQAQQSNEIEQFLHELAEKEHAISQLHSELNSRQQHIEMLNETFLELKSQIEELKSFKNEVEVQKLQNFDEALLGQMQTINDLKNEIEELNQRLNESKLTLIEANRINESLTNEIKIMQFKQKAEINAIRTQDEIEISNRDNTISTLNKKMQTLEEKLKFAGNQIKKKDQFVKQFLVGRSGTTETKDFIEEVMGKYQQTFNQSSEERLRAELERTRKQLELYERYA